MVDEELAFWDAIKESPQDHLPLLVFADYLEERSRSLAKTVRWCVKHDKTPVDGDLIRWIFTESDCKKQVLPETFGRHFTNGTVINTWSHEANVVHEIAYPSLYDAYLQLHFARMKMKKNLFDPSTGRNYLGSENIAFSFADRHEIRRAITVRASGMTTDSKKRRRKVLLNHFHNIYARNINHNRNSTYSTWKEEVDRIVYFPYLYEEYFQWIKEPL